MRLEAINFLENNKPTSDKEFIIKTHNGVFHADEVFAIALTKYFLKPVDEDGNVCKFKVIRSRDKNIEAHMFVDVDGEYNPSELKFDHHQKDYQGNLSSVGMVAKFLEDKYGIKMSKRLKDFIKEIDEHDTGIKKSQSFIIKTIQNLNSPNAFDHEEQDKNFEAALHYANKIVDIMENISLHNNITNDVIGAYYQRSPYDAIVVRTLKKNDKLKKEIEEEQDKAIKNAVMQGDCIVFKKDDPYVPAKKLIGKAHISKQWDKNQDCWSIQTIPISEDNFKAKYRLEPVGDEIFIHKAGFISKTKSGNYKAVLNKPEKKKKNNMSIGM